MQSRQNPARKPVPKLLSVLLSAGLITLSGGALAASVVISQVYGGGGNSGAPYKNDYVELFNAGSSAVSLNGMSVQYASATGTGNFGQVVALPNVTLQPGQYYLVKEGAGAGAGVDLPTPDATGTAAMAKDNGKVVLVNSKDALACNGGSTACTTAQKALIIDLVGYGSANFYEGTAAPAVSNTLAAFRKDSGCQDTNSNSADFSTGAPAPRNTATAVHQCSGPEPVNKPIVTTCPALTVDRGVGGSIAISGSDEDSIVNGLTATGSLPAGITLNNVVLSSADGGKATASVSVAASVATGTYTVPLHFTNNEAQTADCSVQVTVQAGSAVTRIYEIQGEGSSSPLVGQTVTTEGVVTAIISTGFYLQDEQGDGNPLTSDGVFVYTATSGIAVGQKLRLTATVAEYYTVTELKDVSNVQILGNGIAITPTDISLPEDQEGDLERYEGMLVRIVSPMTVTQNYFLGRYGQMTLSAQGRLETPTNRYRPGTPEVLAMSDENARRRILLDDGSSSQNPTPTPYIGEDNTVRAGDTVDSLTGVIDYGLATSSTSGWSDYKLHPTVTPTFVRANPRTTAPEPLEGTLKVAAFNVLNYFTTFTDGTNVSGQTGQGCKLGSSVAKSNCRGADNLTEFQRQQAKIVAAITAIDADVVGLMEIQNDNVALQNLVNALNAKVGSTVYAPITGVTGGGTGTDAIAVSMIYKPAKVSPVGAAISDSNSIHNRPPLAQTFQSVAEGEKFSVLVNHFKSKSCSSAAGADSDQGDGQSCYNDRRKQQASALLGFIEQIKSRAGDNDVLVIGDLNAYGAEDPIHMLTTGGLTDLVKHYVAEPYSYTFDGASGTLDHALATASLAEQVTGATQWRINTDEPEVINYNTEYKTQDLYSATPYRSSDHDPVIVGLNFIKQNRIDGTVNRDVLRGTAADETIYGDEGADVLYGGGGKNVFEYRKASEGGDTIVDFVPGMDRIDVRTLLKSIGYTGTSPFADGWLRVAAGNAGANVQVDVDGPSGPQGFATLTTLRRLTPAQIDVSRDFRF